jgi:hypothetical protein
MATKLMLAVLLFFPGSYSGAEKFTPLQIKPGLWLATARIKQSAISSQSSGIAHTTIHRSCITAEALHQPLTFVNVNRNCTRSLIHSSADQQDIHVDCIGPVKSSGDFHIKARDLEDVEGTSQLYMTHQDANRRSILCSLQGG